MNRGFNCLIMLTLFAGLYISCPTLVYSQSPLKNLFGGGKAELLQIEGPFEFDNINKVMAFSFPAGSAKLIHATYGDITIDCKRIEIYYQDKTKKDSGNKDQADRISRIVIKGDVKINQADGSSVSAENVIYTKADEKVILTGNPTVITGDGYKMETARIIYDLNSGNLTGEDADTGTSRATIYPNELKGKSSAPSQR
jgi:lipopolysaccharide export system protein LptA